VQGIAYRLQSLEITLDRITRHSPSLPEAFTSLVGQASESAQRVFECWAILEPGDAFEQLRASLQDLPHSLKQQLDALETNGDRDPISDTVLMELYAMLGNVKGLIEAMANTQSVISQINWRAWATSRF
jgi:hypothetical protein